ncbi:MAG: glucosamine-6-phosphate deaminase [Actinomycetia bacterium]|nr:glucosamine-6-phosphate deaminase [Actinomycetes bacterium]
MEVVIVADPAEAGRVIATAIQRLVHQTPSAVVGLATGSSPLPIYDELIKRHQAGEVDFSAISAFLLDEYLGLPADHPESYRSFIRRVFTDVIGLGDEQVHSPDSQMDDVDLMCRQYERSIVDAGGVDLQILGIGTDGHIGFNEPVSSLASRTRVKTLTHSTRLDNARFFDDEPDMVPSHVVTQGIGTILEARHLALICTGANKAAAIAAAVEGPVTAMIPASALQLHPHATVVVDEAAATGLELGDYYRATYAAKPQWQSI